MYQRKTLLNVLIPVHVRVYMTAVAVVTAIAVTVDRQFLRVARHRHYLLGHFIELGLEVVLQIFATFSFPVCHLNAKISCELGFESDFLTRNLIRTYVKNLSDSVYIARVTSTYDISYLPLARKE